MSNNASSQYLSQPVKVCRSYFMVMFVLISMPLMVQGGNTKIQDKVTNDLAKLQSFELTSQEIATRPAGDFSSIGTDAACDFDSTVNSIQDVIDTGVAEIRIAANGTYFDNLLIDDQSIVIRGGFVDCTAANNNQSTGELVVINGSMVTASVIQITGMAQRNLVRLESLTLVGGSTLAGGEGGGMSLDVADVELQMLRVGMIFNSAGTAGGGMYINNGVGGVQGDIARDVVIDSNIVISAGGGLFCVGGADVTFTGMSRISNNSADSAAGIHMRNGCEISFYSELFADSLVPVAGIMDNLSENQAGGALITVGAELYLLGQRMCDGTQCLGSNDQSITLSGNVADYSDDGNGDGGGLYLQGSSFTSEVHANGLLMIANSAGGNGGGVYVGVNAVLNIERQSGGCCLALSQSYLEQNRADFGTAVFATDETTTVNIEGSVFYNNGDEGSFNFSDFGVISVFNGASVDIRHSTVVDNNLTSSVFGVGAIADSSLTLFNSIVHDPSSGNLFGPDNGLLDINCLLAHEDNSYSGNQVVVDDPQFFDRPGGDFHLNPISPAIDMCEEIVMVNPLDIDHENRGWDDPDSANTFGTFDAGADESYVNDVIFENGFENPVAVR